MKFLKVNIFSINGLIFAILYILIFFINLTWIGTLNELPLVANLLFSLLDIILLGLIVWSLTSKVEIQEDGINYTSILGNTFIEWKNINSYGVYVVGSNTKRIITKDDYYKQDIFLQKFIFICDKKFVPAMFNIKHGKGYIDFHFREDAMKIIESKVVDEKRV